MTRLIPSARACVVDNGKLLLVSNYDGYWHLPGGHMDAKEGLAACAAREVFEETGYKIKVGGVLYVSEFYDKKWDSHKVECIFSASIESHPESDDWQDLGHDQSITKKGWFSHEEIKKMDVKPNYLKDGKWLKPADNSIYQGYEG